MRDSEEPYELLGHDKTSKPIMIWHDQRFYALLKMLAPSELDNKRPREYFDSIRHLRNVSVHRQHHDLENHEIELEDGLNKIKRLYKSIAQISEDKIAQTIKNS